VLKDGDIINVDVTVYYQGYHGDCSETFCVGEVSATIAVPSSCRRKRWRDLIVLLPCGEREGLIRVCL
jgi:methionine aminopeptidase